MLEPGDSRWSDRISNVAHDVYHLPEYLSFIAAHEGGRPMAMLAETETTWIFLPIVLRTIPHSIQGTPSHYMDAVSPYGYATLLTNATPDAQAEIKAGFHDAMAGLVQLMREQDIVSLFVRLHPLLPVDPELLHGHGALVQHGESVHVDLTLSEDELWKQMRTSHRQDVASSQRRDDRIYIDEDWQRFDDFIEIYYQTMHRVEAAPYYFFSPLNLNHLRESLPAHVHLSIVEIEGRVASAGIVTEVDGITQCFLSGTHTDFLRLCPNKARLHFVSRWAKSRGNTSLHLGGGVGGRQDSLFDFKRGFSPATNPFYTLRVIVNPDVYNELIKVWATGHPDPPKPGPDEFFPLYQKQRI